jgi:ketosteroid isomerase-like protein
MQPREVVEAFDRAVDSGDESALDALCHPDLMTHSFGRTMPQGIEGMKHFVARRGATGGVGTWDQVVTVAEGEWVVQYGTRSWTWPGGGFRGFDAAPGSFRRDAAFLFRVREGLLTDRWAIRDDLAMMVQLGAIVPARPDEVMHGTLTSWRPRPFE